MLKVCSKCKTEKSLEKFSRDKSRKDGLQRWCKECVAEYSISPKGRASKAKRNTRYNTSPRGRKGKRKNNHIRRAHEANLPATLTLEEWELILETNNHWCVYCYAKDAPLQQEHIVPLSMGREYTIDNIVPACGPCNSSKGNKLLIRWLYDKNLQEVI